MTEVKAPAAAFHRDLSYLVLSDVHLGHKNTTTKEIVDHLDAYFGHYSPSHAFTQLDIVFVAGDLFDRALSFTSEEISLIVGFLHRLFDFCVTHDIAVRILEGTHSHDHFQSRFIQTLADRYQGKLDYLYVETLFIERNKRFGLDILYIPDEWAGNNTHKTQEQVEQYLKAEQLSQVDIAIMHGMFTYQVPVITNSQLKHQEAFYLSIVRFHINIGHVHIYSGYDRIVAQGSFDRLTHGEEEAKGATLMYLRTSGDHGHVFIPNKLAKIYKTIHIRGMDMDKALAQIDKALDKLPFDSHVRIKAKKDHPVLQGLTPLKVKYADYRFTRTDEESDKEDYQLVKELTGAEHAYVPITLNKDNIVERVMEQVQEKYALSDANQESLRRQLMELHR